MKKLIFFFFVAINFSFFLGDNTFSKTHQRIVKVATLEWPPYTCSDCPQQGIATQPLIEYFQKMGVKVELSFLPWARAIREMELKNFDALWPCWKNDIRQNQLNLTRPLFRSPVVFLRNAQSKKFAEHSSVKALKDLVPWKTGVVKDYGYDDDVMEFLKTHPDSIEVVSDDETNLKKLLLNRIDFAIVDLENYKALVFKKFKKNEAHFFVHPNLAKKYSLYLGFRKDLTEDTKLIFDGLNKDQSFEKAVLKNLKSYENKAPVNL